MRLGAGLDEQTGQPPLLSPSGAEARAASVGLAVVVFVVVAAVVDVAVTATASIVVTTETTLSGTRTKAEAGTASVAIDTGITALPGATMLALATADEVIGSRFTGVSAGVGVERAASAPAPEALLGAVRAFERLPTASAEDAIARFARGASGIALGGIRRGRFARSRLFETLLDLGAIGGQPFFELIAERAQTLATAPGTSVASVIFCRALCDQIATAIHVIGVELTLLS